MPKATITKKMKDAFVADILTVYAKHGLCISPEDQCGLEIGGFKPDYDHADLREAPVTEFVALKTFRDGRSHDGDTLEGFDE